LPGDAGTHSQKRANQIHIHVFWIPAIHAGMTAYFNSIAGEGWDGGDQKQQSH
jgi:hypothetical protein